MDSKGIYKQINYQTPFPLPSLNINKLSGWTQETKWDEHPVEWKQISNQYIAQIITAHDQKATDVVRLFNIKTGNYFELQQKGVKGIYQSADERFYTLTNKSLTSWEQKDDKMARQGSLPLDSQVDFKRIVQTNFTPNQKYVFVLEEKNVYIINTQTGKVQNIAKELQLNFDFNGLSFIDQNRVAISSPPFLTIVKIHLDDIEKKARQDFSVEMRNYYINAKSFVFSPGGRFLLVEYADSLIKVFARENEKIFNKEIFQGRFNHESRFLFSPEGILFYSNQSMFWVLNLTHNKFVETHLKGDNVFFMGNRTFSVLDKSKNFVSNFFVDSFKDEVKQTVDLKSEVKEKKDTRVIKSTLLPPKSHSMQDVLKAHITFAGYLFDPQVITGWCHAYAISAMNAVHLKEFNKFQKRVYDLHASYKEKINLYGESVFDFNEMKDQQEAVRKKVADKKLSSLSEEEEASLELPAFIQTIFILQCLPPSISNPQLAKLSELAYKDNDILLPLITPKKLENKMSQFATFTGCYLEDELTSYLSLLRENLLQSEIKKEHKDLKDEKEIKKQDPIFTFYLRSRGHAILLVFLENKWTLVDANKPIKSFSIAEEKQLAEEITTSFYFNSKPTFTTFNTSVVASNINEQELKLKKHQLLSSKDWQRIHAPSTAKITFEQEWSWLSLAVDDELLDDTIKLLKAGANPKTDFKSDMPLVSWAAMHGIDKILEKLLEFKGDPNIINVSGLTPLVYSIQYKKNTCFDILLAKNADVNFVCYAGRTPIYFALADAKCTPMLSKLIEVKAATDILDYGGKSPLQVAVENNNDPALGILIKKPTKNIAGFIQCALHKEGIYPNFIIYKSEEWLQNFIDKHTFLKDIITEQVKKKIFSSHAMTEAYMRFVEQGLEIYDLCQHKPKIAKLIVNSFVACSKANSSDEIQQSLINLRGQLQDFINRMDSSFNLFNKDTTLKASLQNCQMFIVPHKQYAVEYKQDKYSV